MSRLRYTKDRDLCITRVKKGKGFVYLDGEGKQITDAAELERFSHLVIPPMWQEVKICSFENGHIQAVGLDAKGRKQYLYHSIWNEHQSETKFNRMLAFGEVLPTLRETVKSDMRRTSLSFERVLATVVWLLEHTFIRIGNREYVKQNNSFGLTTLREKHVTIEENHVKFDFKGKSGVFHSVDVSHPRVARTIQKCIELPGYELFQYLDDTGARQVVDSRDVNEYLRSVTGEEFSAKDFRTWGGTVLAAEQLHTLGDFDSETQAKKNIVQAVKEVASHLRNRPATCRKYYIHPTVLETYHEKVLVPYFNRYVPMVEKRESDKASLEPSEQVTWNLIKNHS